MSSQSCDGCGRSVTVAGGIANVWSFSGHQSTAMTLDLADGTSHLLCFDCLETLPDNPTTEDVTALPAHEPAE